MEATEPMVSSTKVLKVLYLNEEFEGTTEANEKLYIKGQIIQKKMY
jgi:hypothetical protein